jgi:hypothetical protein
MVNHYEEFVFADRMQHTTLGWPIDRRHCPDYRHCKHVHVDDQIRSSGSVSDISEDVKSEPRSRRPRSRKSGSKDLCFLCETYCDDPNRHGSFYSFACGVMKIFCSTDKNMRRLGDKRTRVSKNAMISLWKLWNDPDSVDGLCKFEFNSIFMITDACYVQFILDFYYYRIPIPNLFYSILLFLLLYFISTILFYSMLLIKIFIDSYRNF